MTDTFDFPAAVQALREGKHLGGKDGILTPLIKQLTEAALQGELEAHMARLDEPNRRNGSTPKTVKSAGGAFTLATPRDRNGSFEPQLVKKHQTHLTDELERKILSMFAQGMSYQAMRDHIADMYDMEVSNGTLNAITDKLVPELKAWQERDLQAIYPIVWLDAVHYKIKENGRFTGKALYTILGLDIDGKKELLGLYLSETEGARYWLNILTDLHNRGVKDILIACPLLMVCNTNHCQATGRAKRLPRSHRDHLPELRDPALRHPPDPQLAQIRRLEEPEGLHGRSQACVQSRDPECRRASPGRAGGKMGHGLPAGDQILERKMAAALGLFQISGLC